MLFPYTTLFRSFVQLHELDAFWISLRQQPLCGVGTQYRDGCVEHAAWRVIRGTLQVLAGFRNRDLREDFVIGRSRDEAEERRIVVRIGDDDDADVFAHGHPVSAFGSASGDRPRYLAGLGIDHLDGTVAFADPYFGAAFDDYNAIRSRGIAILQ